MDEVQQSYIELMVPPDRAAEAREFQPINERELFGRHIFLFKDANRAELKELGELRTPGVADLFVAIMSGDES
jgi:ABC-2 type transport system ATP-binding protein